MAVQNWIDRRTVFGIETTEGTPQTTTMFEFPNISMILGIDSTSTQGGTVSSEHNTYSQRLREWSKFSIPEIALDHREIAYLLTLAVKSVGAPTPDGTNGQQRVFNPGTIKTATIQNGESGNADQAAGGFISTLNFNCSRDGATISGDGMAQLLTLGSASFPGSPTAIAQLISDPSQWSVKYADTKAGLAGASNDPATYQNNFSIGPRFGTHWPMDPANPSYKGRTKRKSTPGGQLMIANDTVGRALVTANFRLNTRKYVRTSIPGPVIAGATPSAFLIQFDQCIFITAPPTVQDFQDLAMLPVGYEMMKASDLDGYEITVIDDNSATI